MWLIIWLVMGIPIFVMAYIAYFFYKSNRPVLKNGAPIPIQPIIEGLSTLSQQFQHPYQYLDRLGERYGEVYFSNSFFIPTVVIRDPVLIEQILIKHYQVFGRKQVTEQFESLSHLLPLFENSVMMIQDIPLWRMKRKLLYRGLAPPLLSSFQPTLLSMCSLLVDTIKEKSNLEDFDVAPLLVRFTLDVFGKYGFDLDFGGLSGSSTFCNDILYLCAIFSHWENMLPFGLGSYLPTTYIRETKKKKESIFAFIDEVIEDRRQSHIDRKDMLQVLLEPDQGEELSRQEIIANFLVFCFAGAETTSISIQFSLYHLGRHQEIQEALRKELMSTSDHPTDKDILQLDLLTRVVKETLRISPPFPWNLRSTEADVKVNEYDFPVDTSVLIDIKGVQTDPKIWGEDALSFNPDRWLTPDGPLKPARGSYLPFNIGPRDCMGKRLSTVEQMTFLWCFLRHFKVEVADGYTPESTTLDSYKPTNGMHLKLTPL